MSRAREEEPDESVVFQCRLCLKFNRFCISLIEENVIDIIEILTNIKINEADTLSTMCCKSCLEDIHQVNCIRMRIIESDEILRTNFEECDEIKLENDTYNMHNEEQNFNIEYYDPISTIKSEKIVDTDKKTQNQILLSNLKENVKSTETQKNNIHFTLDDSTIGQDKSVKPQLQQKRTHVRFSLPDDSGVYTCSECDKEIYGRPNLFKHMSQHNLSKCKICNVELHVKNVSDYLRHMKIHSGPQICELCGVVAKNVESLRGHMFYIHRSSAQQYKCEECNLFFRYKYKYGLHIQKHHIGKKTHTCELCGKGFFTYSSVQKHIKMTHMKLRPHKCQYCLKGFSSKHSLRTHVRQHTNETPYICEVCGDGFRQKVSLKTHLKSKHGIDKFTPPIQEVFSEN